MNTGFATVLLLQSATCTDTATRYSREHFAVRAASGPNEYSNNTVTSTSKPVVASSDGTTIEVITDYVTIPCSSTTLTYGRSTYTISDATTLTVTDCSCSDNSKVPTQSAASKSASADSKGDTTVTKNETEYITIPCSSTTLTYGSKTYTVSESTTLIVSNCNCEDNSIIRTQPVSPAAPATTPVAPKPKPNGGEGETTPNAPKPKGEATSTAPNGDKGNTNPAAPKPSAASPNANPKDSTAYVTIPCSSTTLVYDGKTYTVSEVTTLTVSDCSCTDYSKVHTQPVSPAIPAYTKSSDASPKAPAPAGSNAGPSGNAPSPAASSVQPSAPHLANEGAKVSAGISMAIAGAVLVLL